MQEIKTGRWQHFQGNEYEGDYPAKHSETPGPTMVFGKPKEL
ncbi:MAG: DUF1653 domain-containing protein [Negativicutes bacterium]|nr:DUF1653 domain-containing protein [Negativicutes bacterium]